MRLQTERDYWLYKIAAIGFGVGLVALVLCLIRLHDMGETVVRQQQRIIKLRATTIPILASPIGWSCPIEDYLPLEDELVYENEKLNFRKVSAE